MKTVIELWFLGNPRPSAAQLPEIADYWLFVSARVKSAVLSKAVPISLVCSTTVFQITASEPLHAQALLLQNLQHSIYILWRGQKDFTCILIDVPFELDNKNNHGFCNPFFTQKVVFFTELWKSPLALNLSVNVTIGIKIIFKLPVISILLISNTFSNWEYSPRSMKKLATTGGALCLKIAVYFQPSLAKIKQEGWFFPEYPDFPGSKVQRFCLLSWRGWGGWGVYGLYIAKDGKKRHMLEIFRIPKI